MPRCGIESIAGQKNNGIYVYLCWAATKIEDKDCHTLHLWHKNYYTTKAKKSWTENNAKLENIDYATKSSPQTSSIHLFPSLQYKINKWPEKLFKGSLQNVIIIYAKWAWIFLFKTLFFQVLSKFSAISFLWNSHASISHLHSSHLMTIMQFSLTFMKFRIEQI